MSDRPMDYDNTQSTVKNLSSAPPSEAEVAAYKAKIAVVLERGLVNDMLEVPLPDDVYGEWVSRDSSSVIHKEMLGFNIDKEYAPKKSLNDHGDGSGNVGDVVFMTIPKWKKEMIDEVARRRYYETHIADRRKMKEERDFEANNRSIGMPLESGRGSLVNSSASNVDGNSIAEAITPAKG